MKSPADVIGRGAAAHDNSYLPNAGRIKIKQGRERNQALWDTAYKRELSWKCNYLGYHKNMASQIRHEPLGTKPERFQTV